MVDRLANNTVAVIGAGSWGTALALVLARNGQNVRLWSNDAEQLSQMQRERCNSCYLPNHRFPDNLLTPSQLDETLSNVRDVLVVVPSHAFRPALLGAKPFFSESVRLVWGSKGLDPDSGQTLDTVARDVLGEKVPLAVLSGPSFASEVAQNLPTAVTIASHDHEFIEDLIQRFASKTFRLYKCNDVVGVELCGVVKNVLAIATGLCDGLGSGANTRSALITRGMAELSRLLRVLGGDPNTLLSLAGVGDIILTCTTDESRNRRFGLAVGRGQAIDEALVSIGQVVEGYINTKQLHQLAQEYQVEMPIVETLYQVLYQHLSAQEAAKRLLSRNSGEWG